MFSSEFQRSYGDQGLAAAAFRPGVVASNFANEAGPLMRMVVESSL